MFNKQYDGPDVTYYRISTFMQNHKMVAETNQKMQQEGRDLRLEINQWADMHYDEFIRMKGGFNGAAVKPVTERNFRVFDNIEATADSVDWRQKSGIVNDVQNQQQCGSCWAFSATAAVESRWAIHSGNLLKLAEQQLVDCDSTCNGCNGGLMDYAFEYLENKGQELETDYPYTAQDGTCSWSSSEAKVTVKGYTDVNQTDADLAKAVEEGPVSVGVAANNYWQMYYGGLVTLDDCPNAQLDHGVVCVG